ncbi:MAG TPA: uracil-DNA glycosylase [Thermomicrobiales bacterium]|nr:uracil-DNA glycosylase [Thermomicrobiales bacterium]
MSVEQEQQLSHIAGEVRVCTDCELHRSRTLAVPGEGAANAEVMFIGEAPGMNEDRQGRPFVGNAGQFLDEMLESIGWDRKSVFITNIVKCRPPGNRDPLPDEIMACSQYLDRQIEIIDPLMIVTLGRHSMARWFANERISRIHGKPRRDGKRVIVPLYHPAAALHQPSLRAVVQADFKRLPLILEEARDMADEDEGTDEAPEQMSLF